MLEARSRGLPSFYIVTNFTNRVICPEMQGTFAPARRLAGACLAQVTAWWLNDASAATNRRRAERSPSKPAPMRAVSISSPTQRTPSCGSNSRKPIANRCAAASACARPLRLPGPERAWDLALDAWRSLPQVRILHLHDLLIALLTYFVQLSF